jgi:pimeloyl-ACP methyl ester carboxylesterase
MTAPSPRTPTWPRPQPHRPAGPVTSGAGVLGALAVAADATEQLLLGTVRDVHGAVADRVFRIAAGTGGTAGVPERAHRTISSAIYAGIGQGLRATGRGLRHADRRGLGARLESSPRGRFTVAAVNGLLGDRLVEDHPELAIRMAVRAEARDVALDPRTLAGAFPSATPDVAVFLHGLGESEDSWWRRSEETGGSYGDRLAAQSSWTPVYLRANTGLPITENGAALAALLEELVTGWPVDVRRIALVGHSMGGLIIRAACAVPAGSDTRWHSLVTDVVTLGTPHLGAPLERGVHLGSRVLGLLPESAPFGRLLEYRSVGILDLRAGLAPDVQNLPHARYHLAAATLARSWRHPVSEAFGDLLVRYPSATGRPRRGRDMFPGADVLHVRGDHFDLLNHDRVHEALVTWLG